MDLFRRVALALRRGERVALASILEVEGSAPAPQGSRLALLQDGGRIGTIGGGAPEARVIERLRAGGEGIETLELEAGAQEPGLLCGGRVHVLLEQLSPDDAPVFERVAAALGEGRTIALGVVLDADGHARERAAAAAPPRDDAGPFASALARALAAGAPVRVALGPGSEARVELLRPVPRLVVVGAGHVGAAAAEVARAAGLRVAVIDDRADYASSSRFPFAERVLAMEGAKGIAELDPGPADAVVVATRSVASDRDAVAAAAATRAFYVGLLGSRRKWESLREAVAAGAGEEAAARVRCPAGIAIGARTPGEIAVALVAEVIAAWQAPR